MHAIPMLDVNYKCNKCYIKFQQFIHKIALIYLLNVNLLNSMLDNDFIRLLQIIGDDITQKEGFVT